MSYEAKQFIKDFHRMCDNSLSDCSACPIVENNMECGVENLTDEHIDIIKQWAKNHPERTYKMDFMEKFPNADTNFSNNNLCVKEIYGTKKGDCNAIYSDVKKCSECWDNPIIE